jgi:hypothetical protein
VSRARRKLRTAVSHAGSGHRCCNALLPTYSISIITTVQSCETYYELILLIATTLVSIETRREERYDAATQCSITSNACAVMQDTDTETLATTAS